MMSFATVFHVVASAVFLAMLIAIVKLRQDLTFARRLLGWKQPKNSNPLIFHEPRAFLQRFTKCCGVSLKEDAAPRLQGASSRIAWRDVMDLHAQHGIEEIAIRAAKNSSAGNAEVEFLLAGTKGILEGDVSKNFSHALGKDVQVSIRKM